MGARAFRSIMTFKNASWIRRWLCSALLGVRTIEEVERLEKYQLGGYRPTMLGDVLQS